MTLSFPKAISRLRYDIALRTGVVVTLSTLVALLLLTTVVWLFLVNKLESRIENSLEERHEVSLNNASTFSDAERALFQQFRQSLPIRDDGVFAWLDETGTPFASTVTGVDCREGFYDGWVDISESAESAEVSFTEVTKSTFDRFRFLARKRGERCLVFGRSMFEVDALRDSVRSLFLWLVPLCLIPALLISLFFSLSMRGKLRQLATVFNEVAAGNLDARVQTRGKDDLDRLAETTNKTFDRLQESVNTLQQVSSVIAHDLRGPINRVAIPLDQAIQKNESGNVATDSLYEVQEGLNDARSVFDALLRIAQIESGRRRSHFKQLNLHSVGEELFEVYLPVVEESQRILEFVVVGDGTGMINGDVDLLRQALVNLIENAIRYTPEGSRIKIGVLRHGTNPELFVSDNGSGVPESERKNIAQRLYRYAGSTRGNQGHGLGLSLVKAIAELHHGALVLEDAQPGLRTSLRFQLQRS